MPRRSIDYPLTRYPDLQLHVEEAPIGAACISDMHVEYDGGPPVHPLFIACEFRRPSDAPFTAATPRWSFWYDEAIGDLQYKAIRLSPADSARIHEAFKNGLVELRRVKGGRPKGRVISRDEYEAEHPAFLRDFPRQDERVKELARRWAVSTETIHEWHKVEGWPL